MTTFDRGDVEVISVDTLFQGYFRIDRYRVRHRTFAGGWTGTVEREIFERGHAVGVLPYDPVSDRVALIEQFRAGSLAAGRSPWLIEIVAGIIEEGESPDAVAIRETQEEAGSPIVDMELMLDVLVTPGGSSETVRLYCGRVDCSRIGGLHGLAHENEDIRAFTLPFDEALQWVKDGRIANGIAVTSILWLALERDRLRKKWL